jgi:hypothetical protein
MGMSTNIKHLSMLAHQLLHAKQYTIMPTLFLDPSIIVTVKGQGHAAMVLTLRTTAGRFQ